MQNNLNFINTTWYKQPEQYNHIRPGIEYELGQKPSFLHLVHGGFYNYLDQVIQYNFVFVEGENEVKLKFANTGRQIPIDDCLFVMAGHSLGGALAELYSAILYELKVKQEHILCYGVASHPTCSENMQIYYRNNGLGERIHKLYHVSYLTPTDAGVYAHTLSQNPISFGETSRRILGGIIGHPTQYHFADTYLTHIIEQIE